MQMAILVGKTSIKHMIVIQGILMAAKYQDFVIITKPRGQSTISHRITMFILNIRY